MSTSNLKALLRVQWLLTWRGFRFNLGGGRSKWGLLLLPLLAFAFVPIIVMMFMVYSSLYVVGESIGQAHLTLVVALTGGQMACLMFGVFYVISAFYFSKDLKLLLPLPLRPSEIVLSKFIGILLGEYLTMAAVVVPAFIVYGLLAQTSWTYVPFALVIYLLLPILPLVLASLFSLVLMRVTNLKANRDLWRVIGALFGVGLALVFQLFGRLQEKGGSNQALTQFVASKQAQIEAIGKWFPTSIWATNALRAGAPAYGAGGFLMFMLAVAVAMFVLVIVAEKLFLGGLVGGDEARTQGRRLSRDELARETSRMHNPSWALVQREVRLLNRTPSFLMAGVLPIILVPVFVALPLLQQKQAFADLLAHASGAAQHPLVPVGTLGLLLFLNSVSNLPATAISREGRHFWISRSLPVPPRVQVQAKVIHSLMFVSVNILILLGGLAYLYLLTASSAAFVLVAGVAASTATAYVGVLIDLLRPNLKWTDPQQAMKGNMNALIAMLANLLLGGVYAVIAVALYAWARPLLLPGVVALFAAEAWGLSRVAHALADRRYLEYAE